MAVPALPSLLLPSNTHTHTHHRTRAHAAGRLVQVKALLERNGAALNELVDLLVAKERVTGAEVVAVVERLGDAGDLQVRGEGQAMAFL